MNAGLVERITRCPPLPTLPRVAMDVLAMAERPDATPRALARVVSRDPALVAKILRTANSGACSPGRRIGNLDHALDLLGLDGIRTLVLGFSLAGDLRKARGHGAFDRQAYWRRSVYAGAAAEILADEFRVPLREEAFLAALLMDIGMLALDRVLGAEYGRLTSAAAASHDQLAEIEKRSLGMTHADVAAILAERWALPDVLAVPIAYHHRPGAVESSTAMKELTEILWLAGRCADVYVDARPEWPLADVRRTLLERHGVGEIACGTILYRIAMKTRDLAPLFDLPVDDAGEYEAILKRASDGLQKLTRGLTTPADASGDKRRATRHARDGVITVHPCHDGRPDKGLPARFHNASSRGIGLSIGRPLHPGDQFLVRLPQAEGPPASILYTVLRCERVGESAYRIGAELTCVLRQPPAPATPSRQQGRRIHSTDEDIDRIRRAILAPG
jgi:HD-like signal output (HDOD) protein